MCGWSDLFCWWFGLVYPEVDLERVFAWMLYGLDTLIVLFVVMFDRLFLCGFSLFCFVY